MKSLPNHHRIYPWLAGLVGAIMLVRLMVSIEVFSPTTDEPCHIGAAISMVEAHKLVALVSHPPLVRWVAAIPLWLDGARYPEYRGHTTIEKEDVGYAIGTKILYGSPTPFQKLLTHARLAMLIFPVLALIYLYLLARWLTNGLTALLAVAFFSTDPNFLGHGFWVCTDAAACAGYLAGIYHGLRWLRAPSWRGACFAGLAIGFAGASKFSCLILLPALILIGVSSRLPWRPLLRQSIAVLLVGFLAIWATYQFNVGSLGDQNVLGHPKRWENLPAFIRQTPVPMPSFFLGVARLAAHNHFGQGSFLNGEIRTRGWWYYFPELLLLKSPIGFLIAFGAALILWIVSRNWNDWTLRATMIPAGVFLFISMAGRIDIGIRHVLPVIPLLYLFVSWQLARPGLVWGLMCLIACAIIETAAVHPDYLSYFSVAAGGPSQGDRFALDSNLDWNQDVYRLAEWIKTKAPGRSYAIRLTGRRNKPLLGALGIDPQSLDAVPHGRLLFISKNVRLLDGDLPWLKSYQPIAHIGYSIDVYDLTSPQRPGEPDDEVRPDDPSPPTAGAMISRTADFDTNQPSVEIDAQR